MATILVTPEVLNAKANELRSLRSNHDETITRMRSLIMGLEELWKGQSQTAYIENFNNMQGTFTKFSNMIEEYARMIDEAVTRMTNEDAEGAAAISSTITF